MRNEIKNNPQLDDRARASLLTALQDTHNAIASGDKQVILELARQFATWEDILANGIDQTTSTISHFEQLADDDPVVPALASLTSTFEATRPIVTRLRELLDGELSTVLA